MSYMKGQGIDKSVREGRSCYLICPFELSLQSSFRVTDVQSRCASQTCLREKGDLKLLRKWFLVLIKCYFLFSFDLLASLSLAWRQQVCLSETRNLYRWKSVGFSYPVMIMISVTFLNEEGLIPAVLTTVSKSCSTSASLSWQNHL